MITNTNVVEWDIFLACEPLAGKRMVSITERKTKQDWAYFLEKIALQRENANQNYADNGQSKYACPWISL